MHRTSYYSSKKETSFRKDSIIKWKITANNLLEIGIDDTPYSSIYNEDILTFFSFSQLVFKLAKKHSQIMRFLQLCNFFF